MLKKRLFGMMTLIIGLTLVFTFGGCDNDSNPPPNQPADDPQILTYVSTDSGGNLYTLEITENLQGRSARYAAKQGDFFKLTVELFNSGTYTVALTYSGTVDSAADNATGIVLTITVNEEILNITIIGTEMTVISGNIVNKDGETVVETPETISPLANKTALGAAIAAANTAKDGVAVSINGTDIPKTAYWVTQTQMDSFTTAIATAQAFYNDGDSDQSMVNSARITLVAATNVFNGQKRLGTKESAQDPNNDIYVVGTEYSEGSVSAVVWINGQKMPLPGTGYVMVRDIIVSGSDVYVLGHDCYWKNSTRVPLSGNESRAEGMAISGSDVYVVGVTENDDPVACYWKNGNLTTLSTRGSSTANSIFVSGEDVYIAGRDEYESMITSDSYAYTVSKAVYWKNGIRTALTDGKNWAEANIITISGGNVYILGEIGTFDNVSHEWTYVNCYWQGNTRTDLTSSTFLTVMTEMIVSNSDVYVLGTEQSSDYSHWYPAYWKNGVRVQLSGNESRANGMAISGTDVYVAGESMDIACYWKNGSKIALSAQESSASSIAVLGSDVYIAGWASNGSQSIACYWKNGNLIELSSDASASGIVVIAKP